MGLRCCARAGDVGKGVGRRGRPVLPVGTGLGGRIRAERLRAGLTQQQLGGSEYAAGYISNLEHGYATPSLEALAYIGDRLGVTLSDLLGAEPPSLRAADALGRAERLLDRSKADASPEERQLLSAAGLMLGAIRRHLTRG